MPVQNSRFAKGVDVLRAWGNVLDFRTRLTMVLKLLLQLLVLVLLEHIAGT